MKFKKVLLINAPMPGDIHSSGHGGCFPHLGILQIGSAIKRSKPQIESVRCIDGSIIGEGRIADEVQKECDSSTIVGISTLTPTHEASVNIAKAAKGCGATVVMGNDHATFFCEQILRNRSEIDYISLGESGIETFLALIEHLEGGLPITEVPNLGYREGTEIILPPRNANMQGKWNYRYHRKLVRFPMANTCPDISLIEDPALYIHNYNAQYGKLHSGNVLATTVNFGKGCSWGAKGQEGDEQHICNYCGIADLRPDFIDPSRAIEWMQELRERGYSVLYEVCDDISALFRKTIAGRPFLEELASLKIESGLDDVELFVYCRSSTIARQGRMADILKRLNVRVVNIGVDSGSPAMLRSMAKGKSNMLAEANLRAIEKLAEVGIRAYVSFVLGAIGESVETLEETLRFSEKILRFGNIITIDPSPLLPLPGAVAWEQLRHAYKGEFEKEFETSDVLDTERLAKTWVEHMCKATYGEIADAVRRIRGLGESHGVILGGFGVKGSI